MGRLFEASSGLEKTSSLTVCFELELHVQRLCGDDTRIPSSQVSLQASLFGRGPFSAFTAVAWAAGGRLPPHRVCRPRVDDRTRHPCSVVVFAKAMMQSVCEQRGKSGSAALRKPAYATGLHWRGQVPASGPWECMSLRSCALGCDVWLTPESCRWKLW